MTLPDTIADNKGPLFDVRVLELADEKAEFCGRLMAGAGADVIKVEPPDGSPTRRIGPFVDDIPHPERSLHFWHYNFGKRGVTLDLSSPGGRRELERLASESDVLLESYPPGYLSGLGLSYEELRKINPRLIMASITPFGQTGPYRDYKGSDLVHLAMGGVMMLSGYDPKPNGEYDTQPVAPQMWHSSHIVGVQTMNAIVAALLYREQSGSGQYIDASVHQAVNFNTGADVSHWVYSRMPVFRQTARYGGPRMLPDTLAQTKDGRYVLAFVSVEFRLGREHKQWIDMVAQDGCADDLTDPKYQELEYVNQPEVSRHIHAVARRWVQNYKYEDDVWRDAQRRGLHWAPVRRPEENLADPHWHMRHTLAHVRHDDLDRTLTYFRSPWLSEQAPWREGPRAPHLGEHDAEVLGKTLPPLTDRGTRRGVWAAPQAHPDRRFALENVRILDLAWVVAGAAGPRLLAGLGAEDLRVEWKGRFDGMRSGGVVVPLGEERERRLAGEVVEGTKVGTGINQSGSFSEINPGKLSISINLHHEEGRRLLFDLVRVCDVVVENFTARMLEKLGITYDEMRKVNPTIIYVQQPGFGKKGLYQDVRSSAPVGEAFTGLTEQAGLPTPYPPSGWGYLYLDNTGSYYCALALMSALYYRARTGRGQYVDSSLAEPALLCTGTTVLDYQVNRRSYQRTGNDSPYKPAAPHGVYPTRGADRWIAIGAFTEEEWTSLAKALGHSEWTTDERFSTLESRLRYRQEIDAEVAGATEQRGPFELMEELQAAGVPAGVCQTTEDRFDHDPQLGHDQFQTWVSSREVGSWPVREFPVKLSETPSHAGGTRDRGFPCYSEDNDWVYGDLLGLTPGQRRGLEEQDAI